MQFTFYVLGTIDRIALASIRSSSPTCPEGWFAVADCKEQSHLPRNVREDLQHRRTNLRSSVPQCAPVVPVSSRVITRKLIVRLKLHAS